MKTHRILSALVLGALLASPLATLASPTPAGRVYPIAQIGDRIHPGVGRAAVAAILGSPAWSLPDGTWLYPGHNAIDARGECLASGLLVVRFAGDKVTTLAIADSAAVAVLRATTPRTPRGAYAKN